MYQSTLTEQERAEVGQSVKTIEKRAREARNGIFDVDLTEKEGFLFTHSSFFGDFEGALQNSNIEKALRDAQSRILKKGNRRKTILEYDPIPTNQWCDGLLIDRVSYDPDSKLLVVDGSANFLQPVYWITMVLYVQDANTGDVYASTTLPEVYNTASANVELNCMLPQGVNSYDVEVELKALWQESISTEPVTKILYQSILDIYAPMTSVPKAFIQVNNPCLKPNHQSCPNIRIALYRTPAQVGDCDYYYTEDSSYDVCLANDGVITFPSGIVLQSCNNYACYIKKAGVVESGVAQIDNSGLSYNIVNNPYPQLYYSFAEDWAKKAPWSSGDLCDITITLPISYNFIGDSNTYISTVFISSDQSLVGTPQLQLIPKLQFLWGCLAADSMILMSDGSRKRIDEVKIGEKVIANPSGEQLTVVNVWTGSEDKPCFRFTAGECTILVTGDHPMITDSGLRKASQVTLQDKLLTENGYVEITSISEEPYEGTVYNLDLGEDDESATVNGMQLSTMVANGFVVGDNQVQGSLRSESSYMERLVI
ncbi:MAG TPA: Hint domain-containing protein [Lachnospiraceae bacterium]|nr:Hint domain-containing protein [Lachnospiraceae bacterium]